MASDSMPSRLLGVAEALLAMAETHRDMAFRRRAVSTAYYAVFHSLAEACANYVTGPASAGDGDYSRVYRALDHGSMKNAFGQSPLKDNKLFSDLGAIVVQLQAERHRADYLPLTIGLFSAHRARELVDVAHKAVRDVQRLDPSSNDCRMLAVNLLFKERKQ